MIKDMFYVKPGTPAQQADLDMFFAALNDKQTKISARYGMRDYCRIIMEKDGVFLTVIVENTDDILVFMNKITVNMVKPITIINEKTGVKTDLHPPVLSFDFI